MRQDRSRSFRAPPTHARKTIGSIANHRQIVRDRLRPHAKLSNHAGLIAHDVLPAVQLNHPCTHYALTEIFVGRAEEDFSDAVILRGLRGGRGERVVRLELDHGPHHYPHRFQSFLENRELREQRRIYALAGFVVGI